MAYGFNDDKSKFDIEDILENIINTIYPVGSIYMSVNNTNPSTLFGGTWQKIEGKFLLSSGNGYRNGATGGSADAVVVRHKHSFSIGSLGTVNTGGGSDKIYTIGHTLPVTNDTNEAGDSGAGKNMPPYLVVNVWKRTA